MLEVIKQAVPESLKVDEQGRTYQSLGYLREAQRIVNKRTYNSKKGLMRHAMITRNPLLPAEYFAPRGPDALVVDMNKDVEHSLLKCRGRYTVRVATFRGNSTMKLKKIDNLKRGSTMESKLVDAAMKSHQLTLALRKLGYDAYEFHDRHESIVTVGAFQSVGQPRRDGKIEIDPAVHRIMNTFRARTQNLPGYPGAVVPHRVEGIVLDAQPMPVEVPRVSIAANYARRGILR